MQKKGLLIVIEGIDGSGKTTQQQKLIERLTQEQIPFETIHFPRHGQDFFGKEIDAFIAGKFGSPAQIHPKLSSVLFALDRWETRENISKWLDEGKIIIADRYTTSNQAHQAGKIADDQEKKKFISWIDELEYSVLQIPTPDAVIFLDMPVHYVQQLLQSRESENNELEKNTEYLENSYKSYSLLCDVYPYWQKVSCISDNNVRQVTDIHAEVWSLIQKTITTQS